MEQLHHDSVRDETVKNLANEAMVCLEPTEAEMETLENELRKSFVYKELESKERDEGVIVT